MQIEKPAVETTITVSASFENGVLAIATAHAPPISLRISLACALTKAEATELAAALVAWAQHEA